MKQKSLPHRYWKKLLAAHPDDLSQKERTALDKHVADCPACQKLQMQYRSMDALLLHLPPPEGLPNVPPVLGTSAGKKTLRSSPHRASTRRGQPGKAPSKGQSLASTDAPGHDEVQLRTKHTGALSSLAAHEYVELDVVIKAMGGGAYAVTARSSAGEAALFTVSWPWNERTFHENLNYVRTSLWRSGALRSFPSQARMEKVEAFGQTLTTTFLAGPVWQLYRRCQELATRERNRLQIRLHLQAPELLHFPWEYLFDPIREEYLCLAHQTSLVRMIDWGTPIQHSQDVSSPLRMLVMMTHPNDQPTLEAKREKRLIQEALTSLQSRGLIEVCWIEGQTWGDLQRALQQKPWHIFHFTGHGGFDRNANEGTLALANEQGETQLISATQLASVLAKHSPLQLVILNACGGASGSERDSLSSTAAILVRQGIPAVLAMQAEISDEAAIRVSESFYTALAEGYPVDAAVAQARMALVVDHPGTLEWGTPVLYMRSAERLHLPLSSDLNVATGASQPGSFEPASPSMAGREFYPPYTPSENLLDASWSPDTRYLASSRDDGTVMIQEPMNQAGSWMYRFHATAVVAVAWSPDGQSIASAGLDSTIQIWDAIGKATNFIYRAHTRGVRTIAWSPDGQQIASADEAGRIHIWDAGNGQTRSILNRRHNAPIFSLAWSPDGSYIASGGQDRAVRIWDTSSKKVVQIYRGHQNAVSTLAWSPDGAFLASSGGGSSAKAEHAEADVKVWKGSTGHPISVYSGHRTLVRALAWSPDGRTIASGSLDGRLHIWDPLAGTLRYLPTSCDAGILALVWSPDGSRIAIGSSKAQVVSITELVRTPLPAYSQVTRADSRVLTSNPDDELRGESNSTFKARNVIAERLHSARIAARMTQRELAHNLFSKSYLSAIEQGKTTPSLQALSALAERLVVPISYFLGESDIDLAVGENSKGIPGIPTDRACQTDERAALERLARAEQFIRKDAAPEALEVLGGGEEPPEEIPLIHHVSWYWLAGWALGLDGKNAESMRLLGEGLRLAESLQHRAPGTQRARLMEVRERLRCFMGFALCANDQTSQALTSHLQGLEAINKNVVTDRELKMMIYKGLGREYLVLGNYREAVIFYQLAMKQAQDQANCRQRGLIAWGLGLAYWEQNNLWRARKCYQEALEALGLHGNRRMLVYVRALLGQVLVNLGEYEEAEKHLHKSLESARHMEMRTLGIALGNLAALYLAKGETDQALQTAQEASELVQQSRDHRTAGYLQLTLAAAYTACYDKEAAEQAYQKAIQLAEQIHDLGLLGRAHELYAGFLSAEGRFQEAYNEMYLAYVGCVQREEPPPISIISKPPSSLVAL